MEILRRNSSDHSKEWRDPTWIRLQQIGWSKFEVNCELRDRVSSGLFNLSKSQSRGNEWLEWQEQEYKEELHNAPLRREPVEYEDVEEKYNIQDDVEVEPNIQVSERWVARNRNQHDSKFSQEASRWKSQKGKSNKGDGHFSKLDGRYHVDPPHVDEANQMLDHMNRTEGRRPCKYYKRGYCNQGYLCTMAHLTQETINDKAAEAEFSIHKKSYVSPDDHGPRKARKPTPAEKQASEHDAEVTRRWENASVHSTMRKSTNAEAVQQALQAMQPQVLQAVSGLSQNAKSLRNEIRNISTAPCEWTPTQYSE